MDGRGSDGKRDAANRQHRPKHRDIGGPRADVLVLGEILKVVDSLTNFGWPSNRSTISFFDFGARRGEGGKRVVLKKVGGAGGVRRCLEFEEYERQVRHASGTPLGETGVAELKTLPYPPTPKHGQSDKIENEYV